MRKTQQRKEILAALRSTREHPTVTDVYEKVKEKIPDVSLGTVYRQLNNLVDSGEALSVDTDDSKMRYDGFTEPHVHFYCIECKKVYDFPLDKVENSNIKEAGFEVREERTVYYGLCKSCLTNKK